MLTKTTLSAIRALTYLGLHRTSEPLSPRFLAEQLGESPTYLAKVMRYLVKAGILRAHRGVQGGVVLNREPERVSLLEVVEACQGAILGDFCQEGVDLARVCALHQAGAELHNAIVDVLSRWTVSDFLAKPRPTAGTQGAERCLLEPCPVVLAGRKSAAANLDAPARSRRVAGAEARKRGSGDLRSAVSAGAETRAERSAVSAARGELRGWP
jgi:Rrf2 family protein